MFLPCESLILPSSRIWRRMFITSGWAFSISSKRITEYGCLLTFSVSWPASSYPTYPGGEPMSFDTACFSMNSVIAGLRLLESCTLFLLIALASVETASSWPMTLFLRASSIWAIFWSSGPTTLFAGIPVQSSITLAIFSSETLAFSFFFAAYSSSSSALSMSAFIVASFSKSTSSSSSISPAFSTSSSSSADFLSYSASSLLSIAASAHPSSRRSMALSGRKRSFM